jgi:hypothetical protein
MLPVKHAFSLLSLLSVLLWCVTGWAQSTTHNFKGASFDLPTPKGFCIPDLSNQYDANFIKARNALMSNTGNRLIETVAACNELRQPSFPYDFLQYYYPLQSETESLEGTTRSMRKALCDEIRRPFDPKKAEDIVSKTADELKLSGNTKLNKTSNTKYLGVLAEDSHGCYARLVVTTSDSHGPYVVDVHLLVTAIHAKSLWATLNSKYQNPSESQKQLLSLQAIAAELDSKNPN